MKNFDRNIEQMMNEHEVAPPFGMWNRIAAELETGATAVPVSVNSPIPQRTVFGFVAGALFISASLLTAYLVNDYSKEEKTIALNSPVVNQPSVSTPVATEMQTIVFRDEVKSTARISKSIATTLPVAEKAAEAEPTNVSANALKLHTEVSVPTQAVAENNGVTEPYYFPAIDINSTKKTEEKTTASIAKPAKVEKSTEANEREVSSYEAPKIKFRPKKHRSFSYGRIIHNGKRK